MRLILSTARDQNYFENQKKKIEIRDDFMVLLNF